MYNNAQKMNSIAWEFPLPRTHTGLLAGNAVMGCMIWGTENSLKITVGRSDFWDHRGGMTFSDGHNYENIISILKSHDKAAMKELFSVDTADQPGQPLNPTLLPVGHFELELGAFRLSEGLLNPETGEIRIVSKNGTEKNELRIIHSVHQNVIIIRTENLPVIRVVPAWESNREIMSRYMFPEPEYFQENNLTGFVQRCPADPPMCLVSQIFEGEILLASGRGREEAETLCREVYSCGTGQVVQETIRWWQEYWSGLPRLNLPDPEMDEIYRYNMYKFGSMTKPDGVPAGLQGPWIEDYRMPKWAADYHFNINVQMNYFPALKANKPEHLRRMFEMVWSNRERFRHNAKMFLNLSDGYLLPHSVDDQGVCMGRYWSGNTDPASGGWIASMMFEYVKYTGDLEFLREKAYPFMKGTMRVYEALLEEKDGSFTLPVGVSPEWNADFVEPDAWGKNSSYQLACIHRLCEDLQEASNMLGITPMPIWNRIRETLPLFDVEDDFGRPLIGIWEGQKPCRSHRHHSHLASLFPFDTVNIYEWKELIQYTILYWVAQGTGTWAGWSYPWAAIINTRYGNGSSAELMLKIWNRTFTNEGRGTTHDAFINSFSANTLMFSSQTELPVQNDEDFYRTSPEKSEVMQIEAGMGAAAAIQEMLMHGRRGVLHIFPAVPNTWKDVSFENMGWEGGFRISAYRKDGSLKKVVIHATRDGFLKMKNPWISASGNLSGEKMIFRESLIELKIPGGKDLVLEHLN